MKTLKLFIILLFCVISSQGASAQKKSYPEVGATWYYYWSDMSGGKGYYTMEVTKDTLLQGKNCLEFELNQFYKFYDPAFRGRKYVLYEEKKIYQYHDENFYLLYDFTVQVGDTIRTELVFWEELLPVEFEVTGVEEVEVDGETLISYTAVPTEDVYYGKDDENVIGDEDGYRVYFGGGIENIGYYYYFFPTFDNIDLQDYLVGNPSSFNCYQNGDFFYKDKNWDKDCDYTYQWTGIDEYNKLLYSIYINPDNSVLTVIGLEQYPIDYSIIHPNGNTIISGKLIDNKIDISKLQTGMYILQIDTYSFKFVKK